jgi:hypothetical protein
MGDLINLNRARKAKAKAARITEADANRPKFGRSRAERAAEAIDRARGERNLDAARIDEEPAGP